MSAKTFLLVHQFLVTVTFTGLDGTVRTIRFANKDGGNKSIEVTKIRGGGMDGAVVMAGLDDRDEATLIKKFDRALDGENRAWLDENAGCDISCVEQPLGPNKIPVGPSTTYTGILAGVNGPSPDADSSDPATLEVVLGLDTETA